MDSKRCTKCGMSKPISQFHKSKNRADGHNPHCKQCRKIYSSTHKHKQDRKSYMKEHRQEIKKNIEKYHQTIKGHIGRLWNNITTRCNNPKFPGYKNYGGRGIQVKFESLDDFRQYIINELKVDSRGLTIDRIDNEGHYERGNIRFVTRAKNNQNKRCKYSK